MAAVVAQLALLKILRQPIPKAVLITAVLVLVFGSVTLFFRDEIFLQIKTTAINWLFAGALLVADFALGKTCCAPLLGGFFPSRQHRLANRLLLDGRFSFCAGRWQLACHSFFIRRIMGVD